MFKHLKQLIYAMVLLFLLTACTSYSQDENIKEMENPPEQEEVISDSGPVNGGTLNLYVSSLDSVNPLFVKDKSASEVFGLVYDSLVALDGQLKAVPCLAERWEVSPDGMTWTFYLRKDVRWHDNVQFTAKDVDFTFKTLADNQYDSVYKYNIKYVSYFVAEDSYTFKVVLSKPHGNFLTLMDFPIIPRHKFEGREFLKEDMDFVPVGTGPYQIREYEPYKQMKLAVNPLWWGENIPYIDNINVQVMPDNGTALYALEAKELDYVSTDVVDWEKYSGKEGLQSKEYSTGRYEFLAVNFNNIVLSDNSVRKAIAYAIDRDKIINEVLLGNGKKTDVPIQPESWLYDSNRETYNYDVQKAKQILDEGGWRDTDGDGVLDKMIEGVKVPLSFQLLTNRENNIRREVAQIIVNQLKELGMDVTFKTALWDDLKEIIAAQDFDILLTGLNLSSDGDLSFAFHSSEIEKGTNFISYNNPIMDQYIEKALTSVEEEQIKYNYSLLQKKIVEELPYISLYFRTSAVLYSQRLRGDIAPLGTNIYNNIHKWYLVTQ